MTSPGTYDTDTSDMAVVHRAILGALDSAPDSVALAVADPTRVEAAASFYENVLEFLHVHHAGEDELLYPKLEERCPDRLAELSHIDDQHKLLYEPMDAAWAALAAWRDAPSSESGQRVVDSIATVDTVLRPHLSEEEATVVPLCTKWLSPEEWDELPAHAMMTFRRDKVWLGLGLVMDEFTPEQREAMAARMPPEVRQMVAEQWMPAYEAFMAEFRG